MPENLLTSYLGYGIIDLATQYARAFFIVLPQLYTAISGSCSTARSSGLTLFVLGGTLRSALRLVGGPMHLWSIQNE